jgi:hypothetical protein
MVSDRGPETASQAHTITSSLRLIYTSQLHMPQLHMPQLHTPQWQRVAAKDHGTEEEW